MTTVNALAREFQYCLPYFTLRFAPASIPRTWWEHHHRNRWGCKTGQI